MCAGGKSAARMMSLSSTAPDSLCARILDKVLLPVPGSLAIITIIGVLSTLQWLTILFCIVEGQTKERYSKGQSIDHTAVSCGLTRRQPGGILIANRKRNFSKRERRAAETAYE